MKAIFNFETLKNKRVTMVFLHEIPWWSQNPKRKTPL
jgi:hypothetical protein